MFNDSSAASAAPTTRFAALSVSDRSSNISSIDWTQVVAYEPENVSAWIRYIHQNDHSDDGAQSRGILHALRNMLKYNRKQPPQWKMFIRTDLPCVLMDIMLEPNMFDLERAEFKNLPYASVCLELFSACLLKLRAKAFNQHDNRCATAIESRSEDLFRVIWDNRRVLDRACNTETAPTGTAEDITFIAAAYRCVRELMSHFTQCLGKHVPLTFYAAHFLLYHWLYSHEQKNCTELTMEILHATVTQDATPGTAVPAFVKQFTQLCSIDQLLLLTCALSHTLRNKHVSSATVYSFSFVCFCLVTHAAKVFVPFSELLPGTAGLVPSLIMNCHRSVCRASFAWVPTESIVMLLDCFKALNASDPTGSILGEIDCYAGQLNLISLLGRALVQSVASNTPERTDMATFFLTHIQKLSRLTDGRDPQQVHEYKELRRTTTWIWHDTMTAIRAVKAGDNHQQRDLQVTAARAWRQYGGLFGLEEGVDVTTTKGPSELSNERAYWKIPRQCFLKSCGCSMVPPNPTHRVRVCKGCWRVLYCGVACQRSDWDAGHRLVCQPLS